MKKSIITICGCVLLFAGCKEIGPPINFTNVVVQDTTYVLPSVPAADPHNVLIEEFTGQDCGNCPAAHALLATFTPATQLNVVGLYIYGINQADPPTGAANDFRTQDGTDIANNIYSGGVPGFGIPSAGIDRVSVSGSLLQFSSAWSNVFNQRVSIIDSINLSATSTYNTSDSIATIVVIITYLQNVTTSQNLSMAIVEDSITDLQEVNTSIDSFYVFNDVFRDLVTSDPYGDPILDTMASKAPGRVDQLVYSYKVKSGWNVAHCRVVAFVHYSNSEPIQGVLQSTQCKLAGP